VAWTSRWLVRWLQRFVASGLPSLTRARGFGTLESRSGGRPVRLPAPESAQGESRDEAEVFQVQEEPLAEAGAPAPAGSLTEERPRLVVHRSLRNTEGQLVDDDAGRTLLGLSTLASDLRDLEAGEGETPGVTRAFAAGKLLAERAREKGIQSVVFDRGGYKYHGRVKAFADGAREGGLSF